MRTYMATGRVPRRGAAHLSLSLCVALVACGLGGAEPAWRLSPHQSDAGWRPASSIQPSVRPAAAAVDLVWQTDGGSNRLRLPTGLAVGRDGTVTVVDAGNNRLVRLSSTGQVLAHLGRSGSYPSAFLFESPPDVEGRGDFGRVGGGVAVGADGAIFVADPLNARVQCFNHAGHFVATWSQVPLSTDRLIVTDGGEEVSRAGRLVEPVAIAVDDRHGRVYVADRAAGRVHAFDRGGGWLRAWGEPGQAVGQFIDPAAVAVDLHGQVYVADRGNNRIQVFDGKGRFLTAWGGPGTRPEEFARPAGVAVDGRGHVYVAAHEKVLVFSASGVFLAAWEVAMNGGGPFVAGGIAVDDQGDIYVTDLASARVLRFRRRRPWPTLTAAHPTPRPPTPTATELPRSPTPLPSMTPTDR